MGNYHFTIARLMMGVAVVALGLAMLRVPWAFWMIACCLLLPSVLLAMALRPLLQKLLDPEAPIVTPRTIMVLTAAVVGLVFYMGWRNAGLRKPEPPSEAPAPEVAGQDPRVNADHEIFDAVLTELIRTKKPYPGARGDQIVLSAVTIARFVGPNFFSARGHPAGEPVPPDVVADNRRNPPKKSYSLVTYHPTDSRILVRDLEHVDLSDFTDEFATTFPEAQAYVNMSLPGFSHDGRTAFAIFTFGPDYHSGSGYCLLTREGDGWKVAWIHFNWTN